MPDHTTTQQIAGWIRKRHGTIHFTERADRSLWIAAVQTYDGVAVGVGDTHEGSLLDLYRQLAVARSEFAARLLG